MTYEQDRREKITSRVLFITGAGISRASGIPTYRGEGGLYNGRENIEKMLHIDNIQRNPSAVNEIFSKITKQNFKPNKAHEMVSQLCLNLGSRNHLIATQNIDGLHSQDQRYTGTKVIELHGNVSNPRWIHGVEFPDVVFFGETARRVNEMFAFAKRATYVVTIGTQSTFPYVLHAIQLCKQHGGKHIDINPEKTELNNLSCTHIKMQAESGLCEFTKMIHVGSIRHYGPNTKWKTKHVFPGKDGPQEGEGGAQGR